MNAFVVDRQVIVAPEALATFFTLVRFLTCRKHGLVEVNAVWRWRRISQRKTNNSPTVSVILYQSGFSDV